MDSLALLASRSSATRATLCCLLLLPLLATLPTPIIGHAQAQDRDEARAAFQSGVEAFEARRFDEALESFQNAYRIAPHPSVRVNMANCYESLGRPVEAIDHFQRFLIEAENPSPEQERDVRSAIRRLEQQIGEVFLRVSPDGATITIDDETTVRAPVLDAVRLVAGAHTFRVTRPGFAPSEQRIDVQGGARRELRIDLASNDGPVDPGPGAEAEPTETEEGAEELMQSESTDEDPEEEDEVIEEEEEGGGFRLTTPVIIAGGATVALGISAAVAGILALSADSDFEDAVTDSNNPMLSAADRAAARSRGLDARDKANRRALASDLLLVGTGLAGAATVVFVLLSLNDDDDEDGTARLTPMLAPQQAGLQLQGAF